MPNAQLVKQYEGLVRFFSLSRRLRAVKDERREVHEELMTYDTPLILEEHTQQTVNGLHRRYADLSARYTRLKHVAKFRKKHVADYAADVAAILAMPGVVDMTVSDGKIVISVHVRYDYFDCLYDFGDWLIEIDQDEDTLTAYEQRSGIKPHWPHGSEPAYCLKTDEGRRHMFCFGSNYDTVEDLVEAGQYVEAINVAVACMHTVSEGDESQVPFAYTLLGAQ